MKYQLTLVAETDKPVDGATMLFMSCLAYAKAVGVKRMEVNGDGDIVLLYGNDQSLCVAVGDLPQIPELMPTMEAVR